MPICILARRYQSHQVGGKPFLSLLNIFFFFRSLLERVELVNIRWELWEVSVLLLAFAIAQFTFYSCLPYLLKMASATALNLSLLATDYYTIVAGIVFFNYKVCGYGRILFRVSFWCIWILPRQILTKYLVRILVIL